MHHPLSVPPNPNTGIYQELARETAIPAEHPLLSGELGKFTECKILQPSPGTAILINADTGEATQVSVSEASTIIVPAGRWRIVYHDSCSPSRHVSTACSLELQLPKPVPRAKATNGWYQQFNRNLRKR